MKRLLLFVAIFSFWSGFSQAIDVSTNAYTVPQLIEEVLFGTGSNGGGGACAGSISNISWSTGTNFGSDNGIGYFTNFNPSFPLSSGVILSTGNANNAEGPNNTVLGDGAVSWPGDSDLFNYIQGLGIDPGLEDYNNATVLEFDFTPLTDWMSFDFLFASEEYGDWQCLYSDAFAFFLTDVTAGTPPVNLAVIPNTTTPISVVTIRDMQHNTGCSSQNPFYFANFNGDGNAGNSATNFNGETILMTAGATVVPNHVYHIKLVIADRNDQNFDSAVFLGGGSFNIGQANILAGGEYEGVEDFTIGTGTPICGGSELILNAGPSPISGANYSWAHDGVTIPNSNSFSHVVTEPGIYTVTVEFASGCEQSDSIQVDFSAETNLGDPIDICPIDGTTFNLTLNTPIILNGNGGDITYHQSAEDAAFGIPITNPQAYQGELGQTIYATYPDFNTGCTSVRSFQLKICDATAQTPPDMILCEDSVVDGSVEFDLTEQIPDILGDADSADFTITFHTTLAAAQADSGAIGNSADFANSSNPQTIYVRFENNVDPTIYSTVSFQLIVLPPPTTPTPSNIVECDSYTLPGLPAGSTYHSESGGSPT
ncbi:MAG: choice-of-anchor L domain-containing protein, partial [Flavobacterium sp.]|nr:choice-of-anchor L domain-containing protein [Flavobacterium sp.]